MNSGGGCSKQDSKVSSNNTHPGIIPLSVGGTCNLLLSHRTWQRQRDFADVIKVSKQLTWS